MQELDGGVIGVDEGEGIARGEGSLHHTLHHTTQRIESFAQIDALPDTGNNGRWHLARTLLVVVYELAGLRGYNIDEFWAQINDENKNELVA